MAKVTRKLNNQRKYVMRRVMLLSLVLVFMLSAGIYVGIKATGLLGGESEPPQPSRADSAPASALEPVPAPQQSAEPVSAPAPAPTPAAVDLNAWNLLLVNPREALPEAFSVELEAVVGDFRVDKRIAGYVMRMIAKAKEDGVSLLICSAYRTVEYQEGLYNNRVNEYLAVGKTQDEAALLTQEYTAIPGHSEHHTGLALDIVTPEYAGLDDGYADTPAAKWLVENAAEFGFVLRYPKDKTEITGIEFEPWHYRYVGQDAAREIMEERLCLEEYIYIKQLEREEAQPVEAEAGPDGDPEPEPGSGGNQDADE